MFEEIIMQVVSGELSLKEALEGVADSRRSDSHFLWATFQNKNVFVRTVTHHYTGKFTHLEDGFVELSDAAWIADDGRFADFLSKGTVNEVEPYPSKTYVAISSIIDICEWNHELPRKQK